MSSTQEPFRAGHVAIVGRPNVGKSTLLNSLVGQKLSITSRKPQTTRHRICAILTTSRGQCAIVDTPGLQSKRGNALGAAMNRVIARVLAEVDAVVWVLAAGQITAADEDVAKLLPAHLPVIVAINKVDRLADRRELLPFIDRIAKERAPRAIVPVSAQQGYQVARLLDEIIAALPVGPAIYPEDQLTDRNERFFAAEFIREKIFRLLGDELPYAATVVVEKFEVKGKLRRIHASVLVDKPSHKAIVIGAKGERLKEIGTKARKDLEALYAGKVYLQLWVKVRSGWADDAAQLPQLGYD